MANSELRYLIGVSILIGTLSACGLQHQNSQGNLSPKSEVEAGQAISQNEPPENTPFEESNSRMVSDLLQSVKTIQGKFPAFNLQADWFLFKGTSSVRSKENIYVVDTFVYFYRNQDRDIHGPCYQRFEVWYNAEEGTEWMFNTKKVFNVFNSGVRCPL